MKRILARLLIVLLLANLLGVAHAEATVGGQPVIALDQPPQQDQNSGCPDGPRCTHACHLALHFVGMVAESFAFATSPSERSVPLPSTSIFAVSTQAPLRPPRLLA